jgi:HJR/Mrr/RecB family endonuclease
MYRKQVKKSREFNGHRILIIDDEKNIVQTLIDRFEMEGFHAQGVFDNDAALNLIRKQKYDLIMQNMNRPLGKCLEDVEGEFSGVLFYQQYISQLCPNVPAIFYSAWADRAPKEIQTSDSCTIISLSSFDLSELLVSIKSILARSKENLYLHDEELSKETSSIVLVDVKTVTQELMKYLAKHPDEVYKLAPRKYEELVAQIFKDLNYNVTLTQRTRDGGKDIYARKDDGIGNNLYIIECKKYAKNHKVGVNAVRSLYGVKNAERATAGILATTSYFTEDAKKFQSGIRHELNLRDYDSFKEWLRAYND